MEIANKKVKQETKQVTQPEKKVDFFEIKKHYINNVRPKEPGWQEYIKNNPQRQHK